MIEYHIDEKFKSIWEKKILSWYSTNKRDLPWRKPENQNFYRIWISEVMLQQTKVSTVIPFYEKFIKKWPRIEDLYEADLDEILKIWEGLGYYKRAQNIFKAKELLKKKQIHISSEELRELPGVGDYISSSISAILKNEQSVVIDGNIRRIITRVFNLNINDKKLNTRIKDISIKLTPRKKNGNYCQSLMDLANLVCKPKNPECSVCPISFTCKWQGTQISSKKVKKIPTKTSVAIVISYKNFFLIEKTKQDLLQNLFSFPLTDFEKNDGKDFNEYLVKSVSSWMMMNNIKMPYKYLGQIAHKFSHFHLKVFIVKLRLVNKLNFNNFLWLTMDELNKKPISSLMMKVKKIVE